MTKFEIGDRVKCVRESAVNHTGVVGRVYTVKNLSPLHISVEPCEGSAGPCEESRFELYAKAGEFVAGDVVIATEDQRQDGHRFVTEGRAYRVKAWTVLSEIEITDDDGRASILKARRFRLATPEEIAAASPPPMTPDQDGYFATETKKYNRIFTGNPHPVAFEREPAEIPAAEFDFSTIKVGDEVILRWKVVLNGVDDDGYIVVNQPDFGAYYFRPSAISAVIPAPKPKTLRERAIEAIKANLSGQHEAGKGRAPYTFGEDGEFLSIDGEVDIGGLVDAVLAEVEKGR